MLQLVNCLNSDLQTLTRPVLINTVCMLLALYNPPVIILMFVIFIKDGFHCATDYVWKWVHGDWTLMMCYLFFKGFPFAQIEIKKKEICYFSTGKYVKKFVCVFSLPVKHVIWHTSETPLPVIRPTVINCKLLQVSCTDMFIYDC